MRKNRILTLTPAIRKDIKARYKRIRLLDYGGEALELIHRLRLQDKLGEDYNSKGVTLKKGITLLPGTTGYTDLHNFAKAKGKTIKQFLRVKKNKSAVIEYLETTEERSVEQTPSYLIQAIYNLRKGQKVFIDYKDGKGKRRIAKPHAASALSDISSKVARTVGGIVLIGYGQTAMGDIILTIPEPDSFDRMELDELHYYLDSKFPNIFLVES